MAALPCFETAVQRTPELDVSSINDMIHLHGKWQPTQDFGPDPQRSEVNGEIPTHIKSFQSGVFRRRKLLDESKTCGEVNSCRPSPLSGAQLMERRLYFFEIWICDVLDAVTRSMTDEEISC